MSKTQKEHVLNWLKGNKGRNTLTTLEAIQKWGITRLPDRIRDLKLDGHKFNREMVSVYNRFGDKCRVARYSMGE